MDNVPTDHVGMLKGSYRKLSGNNAPTKLVVEGFPQAWSDEPTIVNLAPRVGGPKDPQLRKSLNALNRVFKRGQNVFDFSYISVEKRFH